MAGTTLAGTYTNGIILSNPATQNPANVTPGGAVLNTGSAGTAILGDSGTAWTVSNYGSISGSGQGYGIQLLSGGEVTNGGVIAAGSAQATAVDIVGGAATLANAGLIQGGVAVAGGTASIANGGSITAGLTLGSGGAVSNESTGVIIAQPLAAGGGIGAGVSIAGAGTVANAGSVQGGVAVGGDGVVVNLHYAAIGGQTAFGISIAGAGTVTNYGIVTAGISGSVGAGVAIGGAGSLLNIGTIEDSAGTGVEIAGVAMLTNNGGIIGGPVGVNLAGNAAGSTVVNAGAVTAVGIGLVAAGSVLIRNFGTIAVDASGGDGVVLQGGGTVNNRGLIQGGTAAGGVYDAAGSVANYDTIAGGKYGVLAATLVNAGTVLGGAVISSYLSNAATGTIEGEAIGVAGVGQVILVNAGTIIGQGGTAVALAGGGDLVVVDPGARFVGVVIAGGTGNTLELAAGENGGPIALGSAFYGFDTVKIDAGASWSVSGGGADFVNDGTVAVYGALSFDRVSHDPGGHGVIDLGNSGSAEFTAAVAKGETLAFTDTTGVALLDVPRSFKATISGFAAGDVIDLVGVQAKRLSFTDHTLRLSDNGHTVAELHFAGPYTAAEFALSPDGNGGTDITLLGASAAAGFWTARGA